MGSKQPSSSSLRLILWYHWVGFILTYRASIGGMKLFLTSCMLLVLPWKICKVTKLTVIF